MARKRTMQQLEQQRFRAVRTLDYLNTRNQIRGGNTDRAYQLSQRYFNITRRYGNASVAAKGAVAG